MVPPRAAAQKDPLREQVRTVLVTGLGELGLGHGDVAHACGTTRQAVGLWASPNHEATPSITYVARLAAAEDALCRALGLRLLRAVAAHADADLVDLREADGDVVERLDALDREAYEARHELRLAHADGHLDDGELTRIAKESDEAATHYRGEANRARRELERRRQERSRGRVVV
ncbi:MAG: hypothetical protein GWN84_20805 [Gammaproteobacteria bacterium]|nr:hypothetical protein [Gammaproteobacteria bacterium]NIR85201.1 hypothetical protein [Gammaproteobacteria bacterium]NIU06251.1 hypothetical protein [Gammaproteobacteria bacterium]NIX87524.1 hypothetical protein [Gammaproteobacteria bacterium]